MAKRIVVTVISDLVTDQRVHKVCQTLHENGYEVLLTGSIRKGSLPLEPRDYRTTRIRVLFQRTFLLYAEFNIRLFLKLLFTRADILLGNDLDVMPATYFAAMLKRKPVVYDTHEYYMGIAGLDHKHFRKKCWKAIEAYIFPRVRHIYTVSGSIAGLYRQDYQKEVGVVRNLPYAYYHMPEEYAGLFKTIDDKIPKQKNILIFQGAGINPQRGAEELVLAMKYLDPEKYHLLIVGGGDILPLIKEIARREKLETIISFIPKVPFPVLRAVSSRAQLGLSLDKSSNLNHRFGLPNKIFDYLHAGVPVLSSRLAEIEKIIDAYEVGTFIENYEPSHIAEMIEKIFADPVRLETWKQHTEKVRRELNWENEGKIVLEIFKQVEAETVNK